ncbi:MAG: hypothetical protein JSW49_02015 [candidate division WOR-3 bacterium]|nr:MAG: hypothetical protein JSW49_02015 [candidate division WOR-3 bacterium]
MLIDREHMDRIKKRVAEEYPEFKDVEPEITSKEVEPQSGVFEKLNLGAPKQFRNIYRLKFARVVKTADESLIERILFVTLDENFEIIKIVESR